MHEALETSQVFFSAWHWICASQHLTGPHNTCFAHWQYGRTAIIFAAENGHRETVQLLISNGVDVNHQMQVCV